MNIRRDLKFNTTDLDFCFCLKFRPRSTSKKKKRRNKKSYYGKKESKCVSDKT